MKKLLTLSIVLLLPGLAYAQMTTFQGGTGTSSPSGILYGDSTIRLKTLKIGSGLQFIGGTLSNTGSAGTVVGTVSTSSVPTRGQIPYWTSSGSYPETLGSVPTTTASCSGSASCSSFTVIGSSPVTISATGGSGNSFAFPFDQQSYGNSTSTTLGLLNGFLSTASSTINSELRLKTTPNGLLASGVDGLVYQTATSTISTSGGITTTNGSYVVGNGLTIGCTTASGSTQGCLSSSDWTRFDTGISTYDFPINGNATSTAVGFLGGLYSTAASTTIRFASTTAITAQSANILRLDNLTAGLVRSSANGTLSVDTSSYLTSAVTSVGTNNGLTGGTITTTGTLGLDISKLSIDALTSWNGTQLSATGTPALTSGYFIATSTTATSTLQGAVLASTGGNVGIATSTPSSLLTIAGNVLINTWTNLTNAFTIKNDTGQTVFNIDTTSADPTLGIGSSTPSQALGIQGNAIISGNLTSVANITATGTVTTVKLNATYASTTAVTVANELNIPSGATPFVQTTGDLAVDTTAGQLKYYDGLRVDTLSATTSKSFNIASTTLDAMGKSFNIATSTFLLGNLPEPMTMVGYYCTASSTGTALVRFGDNTNWTEDMSCSGGGFQPTVTNNTWTAFEPFVAQASSTAGQVSRITVTAVLKYTSQ